MLHTRGAPPLQLHCWSSHWATANEKSHLGSDQALMPTAESSFATVYEPLLTVFLTFFFGMFTSMESAERRFFEAEPDSETHRHRPLGEALRFWWRVGLAAGDPSATTPSPQKQNHCIQAECAKLLQNQFIQCWHFRREQQDAAKWL